MSVAGILASGRRAAEELMSSTCRITREELVSLDTASLNLTDIDPSDDLIYAGPCRLSSRSSTVSARDVEGQVLALQQVILSLPISVPASGNVMPGDQVEITDGGPDDPSLTGRRLRVAGRHSQTQATARRYPVEEQS